jgi:DNA-binding NarL/FixJ family response regulator
MSETQQLSRLIGTIYDAALDAKTWPVVLEGICGFLPGSMGNIFYQDISNHEVRIYFSWGADPAYEKSYFEKYAPLNPLFPAAAFLDVGSVHSMADMMSPEEFRDTRLYREWVQPQGILDAIYSNIERTATGAAAIAFRRFEKDGLFDEDSKKRLQLLVPHVQRAISIGRLVNFHKEGQNALAKTLDRLANAVFLIASDRKIVFANEVATAMVKRGEILRASQNLLSAVDTKCDQELQDAIAAASRGDAALGVKGIAIMLSTKAKSPYVAHIMPLTSGNRSDPTNGNATTAVFVRQASEYSPSALELTARNHRLTASETRVLSAVLETGSVDDIAERLGIGKATVKTHLNHLLSKTGARRQSDLLRLVSRYENGFLS